MTSSPVTVPYAVSLYRTQCFLLFYNTSKILTDCCRSFSPSKSEASALRQMINDTQAFPAEHYTPTFSLQGGATAAQVMVMGPDDIIVSVMRQVPLF